ncbi:bifunctional folylpolyglutamate synthase/dihydrofolate synthase [Pararhodospirillum photometricum]|uniref:Dihydrofolate synthase/folylpolyglutamate synthase n=1 Tax=Pararhodospirillum photometricum DSM 122 TaxID=1150469 RepID=H6SLS7_PARPM|nr:folylpolyglutamate synthase/dihydrofolate synthase family protein [Pararhodospirillum photometricum]CCG08942.1 Folylpolyglutamate synthetase [Pararhodospirillum photometricum DSM 122]
MGPDATLDRLTALHPKVIDLSLERIHRLLAALGDPQARLAPVIHVAGTNGKGSVVAHLRAALEAAGHRVHVYTSPHLVRFNERIRLGGQLISDDALIALLEEVEAANAGQPITFFEVTTAAALLAFSREPADVVLLETGLGGRLDATNVLTPAVTVLTPIGLDHQAFLGATLAAVAREKAGILKPGVPAVSATQPAAAADVVRTQAAAVGAPLQEEGVAWTWEETPGGWTYQDQPYPRSRLPGRHQLANAALAWAAIDALAERTGLIVPANARADALARVDWPARLQRLSEGALASILPGGLSLWLDGGHNPHAAAALAPVLSAWSGEAPVDLVCGMLQTKDNAGFLALLAPYVRTLVAVGVSGSQTQAGLPAHALAVCAREAGVREVRKAASVRAALEDLARDDGPARILICGSLYLAGTVLTENGTVPE